MARFISPVGNSKIAEESTFTDMVSIDWGSAVWGRIVGSEQLQESIPIGIVLLLIAAIYIRQLDREYQSERLKILLRSLVRLLYWRPTATTILLSLLAAVAALSYFNTQNSSGGAVFASTLYASLFFFNETLRSEHPKPTIVEYNESSHPASDDDEVAAIDGTALVSKVKIANTGYSQLADLNLQYRIISKNFQNGGSSLADYDDGLLECGDAVGEVSIDPGTDETFTLDIDIVDSNTEKANYSVLVEAKPSLRYTHLTHRKLLKMNYELNHETE